MVNTSLKELKRYLTVLDHVFKERTTATTITDGPLRTTSLGVRTFVKDKMNQVLSENERLLAQAIDKDIVKTVVNLSVNASDETVTECQKCLELETELVKKKDFVNKETYDKLCKRLHVSDNLFVANSLNVVKSRANLRKKSKKDSLETHSIGFHSERIIEPTCRTHNILGNACPLTMITTTNEELLETNSS
ncbi:hypothetical protein Tco_0823247 [Tanacetum coccineum]|uniref:Uncharacterized protein n=1 Tax=Tanacetum coccineum TaxID=301880 RepID=A0ABQ5AIB5_9ASTR